MRSLNISSSLLTKAVIFAITVLLLFLVNQIMSPRAHAAYNGARLIDNGKFLDANSMSASQIQSFLVSKNSGLKDMRFKLQCYGAGSKERQWYTAAGAQCDTNIPASHIIYYAAKIYGVNPMVILATMQKEQSLITAPNPTNWQLSQAMGYACPTSGSCNSSSNFSYQVDSGTWVLRFHYERANGNMTWWRTDTSWTCGTEKNFYKPHLYPNSNTRFYDSNNVHYRTHNLYNAATSSMYCYTPHAYNNPNGLFGLPKYGTKGQYYTGSYNFVRFYELWFGSTIGGLSIQTGIHFPGDAYTSNNFRASFTLRNTGKSSLSLGNLRVAVRDAEGNNFDLPSDENVVIGPGKSYTYSKTRALGAEGDYTFFLARYANDAWQSPPFSDFGLSSNGILNQRVTNRPTLTSELTLSGDNIHANQDVTATFTIRNNSNLYGLNVGNTKVAGRDGSGTNVDFAGATKETLAAGESYVYSATRSFPKASNYRFWITNHRSSVGWSNSFPSSETNGMKREVNVSVKPQVTLTSELTLSGDNIHANQDVTATFTIRNHGKQSFNVGNTKVAVRDSSGRGHDFDSATKTVLAAGESYTYTSTRKLPTSGQHRIWVTNNRPGVGWTNTFPANETSGMKREINVSVKPQVTLTSELSLSESSIHANQDVTASFTIKNHGAQSVNVGNTKVAGRDGSGTNVDFAGATKETLAAGESYVYSATRSFPKASNYRFWITNHRSSVGWSNSFPSSETNGMKREVNVSVKPQVTVTTSLATSISNPGPGTDFGTTLTVKNFGNTTVDIGRVKVAVRNSSGDGYDFPSSPVLELSPGQEYTYIQSRSLPPGRYNLWIANYRDDVGWSDNFPQSETPGIIRSISLDIN